MGQLILAKVADPAVPPGVGKGLDSMSAGLSRSTVMPAPLEVQPLFQPSMVPEAPQQPPLRVPFAPGHHKAARRSIRTLFAA
jgi:hypothetical protein